MVLLAAEAHQTIEGLALLSRYLHLLDLLKKLPPTLLVVGAHEVLLDESLQLGGAIKDCRVVVFEDMWHDFFLYGRGPRRRW